MVKFINSEFSQEQGRSRHGGYHAMKIRSASLIAVFTSLVALSFVILGVMVSTDWTSLCYNAATESGAYNHGFRRIGTFEFLDSRLEETILLKDLNRLSVVDQYLFIKLKLNETELSGHNAKGLIKHLALLDAELARSFILECLLPSESLEKRRQAVSFAPLAGDEWSKSILTEIALDVNESSFVRRKALKTVGIENIPVDESIGKLLSDEDIILRKISGKYLFALAKGNESLQLKVFGSLRCQDLQWVEKEVNKTLSQEDICKMVTRIATLNKLDPALVMAVIQAESNFDPLCVSRAGAQGLMQLMPVTAVSVGVNDPFDVGQNILGGVTYLKKMMDRFGNNVRLALAAYNAGPTTVARYEGVPPYKETRNYIKKVLKFVHRYKSKGVVSLPRS
jgi:hypothetical protein